MALVKIVQSFPNLYDDHFPDSRRLDDYNWDSAYLLTLVRCLSIPRPCMDDEMPPTQRDESA